MLGIAKRPMAARLNLGFKADGKSGYHGYKWKILQQKLRLSVWTANHEEKYVDLRELETVEAEVAFLCRQNSGQWPKYQYEIHFYPSEMQHREAVDKIYNHAINDHN